ncbi:flagellar hook-basal body complex protein FliE [Thorsellia anophelis]|uniref:Flagellar hook-basal body complex protein FliE n=1 Tax=Thorsellia anophelis DSM 18579 TaxID=1123402 RepID=A0A1H9ZTL5_9GAMM|nr:flagellar hook-basal body complex protein FliE [Thorsellia anophelis]SES85113.1 flagellar hook-basal body complex protein FliE [Thorsellia anophelis DSM 18579]
MTISAINDVVNQMQSISGISSINSIVSPLADIESDGFTSFLNAAITKISDTQNAARIQAEAFERGEPGLELSDIMVDLQKASIGLQLGVQVRNRVVQAYQEIMNMPV